MAIGTADLLAKRNKSPAEVRKEQELEVYGKLFPHVNKDFVYEQDLHSLMDNVKREMASQNGSIAASVSAIATALSILDTVMSTHTHLGAAPGSPVSPSGIVTGATANYSGQEPKSSYVNQKGNAEVDYAGVSGFDGSVETRKKGTSNLEPPLTSSQIGV